MAERFRAGHALIVGVGADLPNTITDAQGMSEILTDETLCAYLPEQVVLRTGEGASRDGILSALDALAAATSPDSTAVVYFSGHGYHVTSSMGEAYYLMPFGYDLSALYRTAISGADFSARLAAIPAARLLVLLDCCHAGGVGQERAPGLQVAKAPVPRETLSLLGQGNGRVLIASSQAQELSFAGDPLSAFTLALVEALCGEGVAARDGLVRVADLALHAREMVPARTNGRQHPILNFEHADNFPVSYYAGGDVQAKGLPFEKPSVIEPQPGAFRAIFEQRGQKVYGSQTNVSGNIHGIVLSGSFSGPITVNQDSTAPSPQPPAPPMNSDAQSTEH